MWTLLKILTTIGNNVHTCLQLLEIELGLELVENNLTWICYDVLKLE